MRFHLSVPAALADYSMAISPNGRFMAYIASASASAAPSLFVRETGSVEPRLLDRTEGASYPFWSPDSRRIGFFAGGRLKRIDIAGGPPKDICAVSNLRGGTWNKNNVIVFGDWPVLRRVSANGGEPTDITRYDEKQMEPCYYPFFLPDGNHFLYEERFSLPAKNGVFVGSLDSMDKTRILTGETMAIYADPGYILFQQDGTLFAQRFDPETLRLSGDAVRIADGVLNNIWGWAAFAASDNGMLVYRTQSESQFMWFDRSGGQHSNAAEVLSRQQMACVQLQ